MLFLQWFFRTWKMCDWHPCLCRCMLVYVSLSSWTDYWRKTSSYLYCTFGHIEFILDFPHNLSFIPLLSHQEESMFFTIQDVIKFTCLFIYFRPQNLHKSRKIIFLFSATNTVNKTSFNFYKFMISIFSPISTSCNTFKLLIRYLTSSLSILCWCYLVVKISWFII